MASTYMNIPLAHTQGGEITGQLTKCRHATTKLAHIHFPATKSALNLKRLENIQKISILQVVHL